MVNNQKECKNGVPCGDTCINKSKNCLKELGMNAGTLLEKYVQLIQQQSDEVDSLSRGQKSVRTKKQAQFDAIEDAQSYLKYHEAMKEIETSDNPEAAIKKLTEEPWTNPVWKFFDGGRLSDPEAYKAKRAEADELAKNILETLPGKERNSFLSKGSPCARKPEDRPGICSLRGEERTKAFKERGVMLLSNLLMTDFQDPVTNKLASWRDLDPDHIVPLARAGGANTEVSANYNWVDRAYNQTKKSRDWEAVKGSMEKLSTPEGFEEARNKTSANIQRKAKLERTHKDNLKFITEDREAAEDYIEKNLNKIEDFSTFTKALLGRRPFTGPGGRGVYGKKASMSYIAKLKLGVPFTDEEQEAFNADVAASLRNNPKYDIDKILGL